MEIYVLAEELEGLDGFYHPFGDPRMGTVEVRQVDEEIFRIANDVSCTEIYAGEAFSMNHLRQIFRKRSPEAERDPIYKVIAKAALRRQIVSRLPQKAGSMRIFNPDIAVAYSPALGEQQFFTNGHSVEVGPEWELIVTHRGNRSVGEKPVRFHRIYPRPRASSECATWLEEKIGEADLLLRRSGMFDYYL